MVGRGWGGEKRQFDPPPRRGFLENVFSEERERVKPWFLVTFNIILKYIFPENLIESAQVVQKI